MAGYEIGISGLHAAQKALDIIGNNIANAATEGYHRQEIDLRPADEVYTNGQLAGQGVEFAGVRRQINQILEDEIQRQGSVIADLGKRLEILQTIESAFGELSTEGLSTAIDEFFEAFDQLTLRPYDVNLQSTVLSSAETLSNQFRSLAQVVSNMEDMMYNEAISTVDRINILASQIAEMNKEVYAQKMRGNNINNTLDQRDLLVAELSELIGIRTVVRETGMVDITATDVSLVVGSTVLELEVGLEASEGNYKLGLRPKGTQVYDTNVSGGVLGGLFELKNELLHEISTKMNQLAQTIISETNQLHSQGVGSNGSFTSLSGWTMTETNVADFEPPVTEGDIYIRVIDADGNARRYTVTVTSASTLSSVAADIAAIPGLDDNSGLNNGRLQIIANTGYSFDFLPGALAQPSSTVPDPLAGAGPAPSEAPPVISVSGNYTGSTNQVYTCTVSTTPPGQTYPIGTGTMELEIRDGSGLLIKTVNIGEGYSEGTSFVMDNGVTITLQANGLSSGYLNDSEQFAVETLASSDTSGFLSAVGINCFFSGTDAYSIGLSDFVKDDGGNIATSRSVEMTDNENAAAIAALGDLAMDSLGQLSPKEYYRKLVVDLGNQVSVTDMEHSNVEGIRRSLEQQRNDVSGVDINEQATLMMLYERMFQAMARYMNTITETYDTVLTIIR